MNENEAWDRYQQAAMNLAGVFDAFARHDTTGEDARDALGEYLVNYRMAQAAWRAVMDEAAAERARAVTEREAGEIFTASADRP